MSKKTSKKRVRKPRPSRKKVKVEEKRGTMSKEDALAAIELIEESKGVREKSWERRLEEALERASEKIPYPIYGENRKSRYAVYKIGEGGDMIVKLIKRNCGEEEVRRAGEVGLEIW